MRKTETLVWKEFEERLAKRLDEKGIPYASEVAIAGMRVDFAFMGPQRRLIIVDAKTWDPTPTNVHRALRQLHLYKRITGAAEAYAVFPTLIRSRPEQGLVNENELIAILEKKSFAAKAPAKPAKALIFAAIPFSEEYDDVYAVAMAKAAKSADAVCDRVDHRSYTGDVVQKINPDYSRIWRKVTATRFGAV
jgi:hypothetical protein